MPAIRLPARAGVAYHADIDRVFAMIIAATHTEAAPSRFARMTADGHRVWRSVYFGPAPSPDSSASLAAPSGRIYVDPAPGERREPQAFLVEQEAGAVVHPHFHFVDQFQVVVAGGGSLGRHAVAPISVHFAAACTGYGPIQPGTQGLSYFTFRASADETGAQYLPAARDRMRPSPKRNVVVDPITLSDAQSLAARVDCVTDTVLEKGDGLAVYLLRLAPGKVMSAPDASNGDGVSMLIARGQILREGISYSAWSCVYASPDEQSMSLTAGISGAEVLVMRFPRAAG